MVIYLCSLSQNVPRTVVLDPKTQTNLIQWPVEETETLRSKKYEEFKDVILRPGSLVPLDIGSATEVTVILYAYILLLVGLINPKLCHDFP